MFDPRQFLIPLDGKNYLPVVARVYWFRQEHPDWTIITRELDADETKGLYRIECEIRDDTGRTLSVGRGRETQQAFAKGPYEKAETIAIGRALATLGYGTLDSLDFEEEPGGKIADAPVKTPSAQGKREPVHCVKCGVLLSAAQADYAVKHLQGMCKKCFDAAQKGGNGGNGKDMPIRNPDDPATDRQKGMLAKLFPEKGFSQLAEDNWLRTNYEVASKSALTKGQASDAISKLMAMPNAQEQSEALPLDEEPPIPEPEDEEPPIADPFAED